MSALEQELRNLEGILYQNPETGAKVDSGTSFLHEYTNRIFGAPFQLLDSVDKRFGDINDQLGNKYLKNFILNSPILHIKPGMPKYTGGTEGSKGILKTIKRLYVNDRLSNVNELLLSLSESTIFGKGSMLQRRMFGFRETYYDYMQHVNYMCRSMAIFLNLTTTSRFPNGTFTSEGYKDFANIKWENYRMLRGSKTTDPFDLLLRYSGATVVDLSQAAAKAMSSVGEIVKWLNPFGGMRAEGEVLSFAGDAISKAFSEAEFDSVSDIMANKITSVEFVVEPVEFTEELSNKTKESVIESSVDAATKAIVSEIGFITNSDADLGMLKGITDFLGNTVESAVMSLSGITKNVTGGFMSNLFSGAIQSIKGQKMIYPKIYESSDSGMNYQFSVILTTPYGDVYNYFMHIIVPLMHLITLAAPRLVSSNSMTSPYLVQCYVPGQCTCHLGIISNMIIIKNPGGNHVSVNGFPLTVKVSFTVEELYNAMAISPANNPASFLFNETLNDYMSNLAGLIPSTDTYNLQRRSMFEALDEYITEGGFKNDVAEGLVEKLEDISNPFIGR